MGISTDQRDHFQKSEVRRKVKGRVDNELVESRRREMRGKKLSRKFNGKQRKGKGEEKYMKKNCLTMNTSGQSLLQDNFTMSHSILRVLHSASERESNQGSTPLVKREIRTRPYVKCNSPEIYFIMKGE